MLRGQWQKMNVILDVWIRQNWKIWKSVKFYRLKNLTKLKVWKCWNFNLSNIETWEILKYWRYEDRMENVRSVASTKFWQRWKCWNIDFSNIETLAIETLEMLKYWCYEDRMGRFGNVGSVALQDLAKVPPGHSSLLCQLSLICALYFSTGLVQCSFTLNTCTALVH